MKLVERLLRFAITRLGYEDIIHERGQRRHEGISTKSEDQELTRHGRLALSSHGRDLLRKLSIAGFAIRKHLQFVAKFDFQCAIPNEPVYSDVIKKFVYHWSRAKYCDVAQRHPLAKLIKLIETHRVVDGDVGILKLSDGRLQLIESDRIANPPDYKQEENWQHGVLTNSYGKALKYAIHARNKHGGFTFERIVSAENFILCGYNVRNDQVRGVPPLASAINLYRDVYESVDYALAKAKVSQLIGLMTKREDTSLEDEDESAALHNAVKEKFGHNVVHLDLGVHDDAKMIESANPSKEFQDFMKNVIRLALAALDIPYSFYDSGDSNYYGSRGALDNYIESCVSKQDELIEFLHETTDWRLRMAMINGELPLPPKGLTVDDVLWYCDWIGARLPLWRLIDDAKGYLVAIQSGLLSPQEIAAMYGNDYDATINQIATANNLAKELGVIMAWNQPVNIGA
jgi:capsid protein